MWTFALAAALAAPPSSTLTGPDGTLSWTVEQAGDTVKIQGSSPKWTVTHTANADLTPVRTERTSDEGTVVVEYTSSRATVTLASGKTLVHDDAGIWDVDVIDVRLGHLYAKGQTENAFKGIDTSSGKVYSFDTTLVGKEDCSGTPCGHVRMQLTGVYRMLGPTFDYWFGGDGKLLRMKGPNGTFAAK